MSRAYRALRDGQELNVRRKKWDARYAHPTVDTPPSKPVTVVCEQPKPSKVTMPKKAEAASELLILFNTQTASTVLKDGAVHDGGDVEVRTAVQRTCNSVASAQHSAYFAYFAADVSYLPRTQPEGSLTVWLH